MSERTQQSTLQQVLTQTWSHRGPLAWLLRPIAVLFQFLTRVRRALYQSGIFKTRRVPALVIVVGNVVAGGSGKTPVVIALVQHLLNRGFKVGVVSRGYGRRTNTCLEVRHDSRVTDIGDEPALIKQATAVPVFVASRRFEAASQLLTHYPETEIIVCDDGLQHLSLHRDLEICVFDDRGLGNGWLLPAGLLREPWPRDVDLVLHTGSHPAFPGFTARRALAPYAKRSDGSLVSLCELQSPQEKPVLAIAAIAKPEDFFVMLRASGLHLSSTLALPDHHDFAHGLPDDVQNYTVVCTEKDAVKLWQKYPNVLAVPLILTLEPAFLNRLNTLIAVLLETAPNPTLSLPHGHTTS